MFKKLSRHPVFLKNLSSLLVAQGFLYLFHIITLPYVTRTLGPDSYGIMGYILALVGCCLLITEWGFNLYGVKEIVKSECDICKSSNIFWNIFISKLTLATLCLFFISIYLIIDSESWWLYLVAYIGVLSAIFNPGYYYQALQDTAIFTYISLVVRILGIGLTYLLVKRSDDILFAILILCGSNLVISLLGIFDLLKRKKLYMLFPVKFDIYEAIKKATPFFFVNNTQQIYFNLIIILVGLLSNIDEVAFFSAAYFFLRILITVQQPITQAIFPKSISTFMSNSSREGSLKKLFIYGFIITVLASSFLYFFADYLIYFIYGEKFAKASQVLRALCLMPIAIFSTNFFGVYLLLSAGFERQYVSFMCIGVVLGFILATFLIFYFNSLGASLAVFLTECIISILMVMGVRIHMRYLSKIFMNSST